MRKATMFYKNPWFYIALLISLLFIGITSVKNKDEPPTESTASADIEVDNVEVVDAPKKEVANREATDIELQYFDMLSESFYEKMYVEFDKNKKTYILIPGERQTETIMETALLAESGDEKALEIWEKLSDSMKAISETTKDFLGSGYGLTLKNPVNTDQEWMYFFDGFPVYDIIKN